MTHTQATKRAFRLYEQYKTDTREYRELAERFGISTADLNARNWRINADKRSEARSCTR